MSYPSFFYVKMATNSSSVVAKNTDGIGNFSAIVLNGKD